LAVEKMLAGLSSCRYGAGLEPAGQAVADQAAATVEVGGVAPVRRRDRDRAGGADVPLDWCAASRADPLALEGMR
jgi:hypothetical protein